MANLIQSTTYTRVFFMYLNGQGTARVAATGKTVTVNLSKAGAAFSAAAGSVSEITNGAYKVVLTTVDTNTLGDLAFNCTATGSDQTDFTDQVGPVIANIIQINGGLTTGNNATLSLAKLNIVNSAGDAIVASSTGGNGHGLNASGNGAGYGLVGTGGTTGHGLVGIGGATSGSGILANGTAGNSSGFSVQGFGSGAGIGCTGGTTGNGFSANGGNTSGHGFVASAQTSGDGIYCSGAGTNFHGLYGQGASGNGSGITATGIGNGHGLSLLAGITGHGLSSIGGATNGNGITCSAAGSGEGLTAIGVGNVSILATQGISGPLDAGERNNIADALLKRDMSVPTGEASRSLLNCLRFMRNKWSTNGNTLTVTKEDDSTTAWTSTITTNVGAAPIVSFSGN